MTSIPPAARAFRLRTLVAALALAVVLAFPAPLRALPDNAAVPPAAYAERASAEKQSRSKYRVLEWTSVVLIVLCGGALIVWAIRRRNP